MQPGIIMTRIGFLGVGHLAEEMIAGLMREGRGELEPILSPRGYGPRLAEYYGLELASDNAALVGTAEIVVLATRPRDAVAAITGLPWREGQILVSACAGVPISALAAVVAPAEVMRIMPLTASSIGASPTTVFPDLAPVRPLLRRLGTVIALDDEGQFEAATVSAAIYGWAQSLIGLGHDWSLAHGLGPDTARQLAAATFVAAGRMIAERPEPIAALVGSLTTPGGITERGQMLLDAQAVPASWTAACDAVFAMLTNSGGRGA